MSNTKIDLTPKEHPGTVIQAGSGLFKIDQLDTAIREYLQMGNCKGLNEFLQQRGHPSIQNNYIFSSTIFVEVMQPNGKGWERGQLGVKLVFEFQPDPPPEQASSEANEPATPTDSPLEALRQTEIVEG
jgi:hypothetical protein